MLGFWAVLLFHAAAPTLLGRVLDPSGKPVSHADVILTAADGQTQSLTTNAHGGFKFDIAGRFQLKIQHAGFRSLESNEVALPSEGIYQVDIDLQIGDATDPPETVDLEIQAQPDTEAREDPTASAVLPKSDRLFGLGGGVNVSGIKEGAGQQWIGTTGDVFTSSSMSAIVSGNANLSADFASTTSVDDALPSGEDTFHGNIHYYLRNDALNARNFFDDPQAPIPPYKYDFFGGDSGGRVGKNTYLYMQYWGLRIGQSVTRLATVPDPAWLQGDFSSLLPTLFLLDPETTIPFPGNQIPTTRFDPAGLAIAKLYPAPNFVPMVSGDPNYRAVAEVRTVADSFGFRLDRRWTSSDEAFLEYQFNRDNTDDPFNLLSGITNLPSYGVRDALQTHSVRLNNTHVFSPELVYQTRFSMAYLKEPRTILDPVAFPAILMADGISDIGHASNVPQDRLSKTFALLNDLAWQRPKSSTKVGAEVRYFPFHGSIDLYSRGQYQFTGGIFSGNSFANLLLGFPTNALQIQGNTTRDYRSWMFSSYVQHDWRPLPRLSINAGLRYDYQSPFVETHGLAANFNPSTDTMDPATGGLYNADRNNFGPRLGLSMQPAKSVIVRAAYGVFYDTLGVGDSLFLLGLNPPYAQFILRNNGPVVPEFGISDAFSVAAGAIPPSAFSTSRNLPNPYIQQWNLSVERPLWGNIVAEVAYYGQKGTRLRRVLNVNQPSAGPQGSFDDRRPFPNFGNIFQFETSASSIAHAADLHVSRRFGNGLSLDADYRFSRMIDDATLISVLPQDSHNLKAERGLADFQMKHRLTFQATANLPAVSVLKNWQFHAIGVAQSGTPLSAVLSTDVSGTGFPIVNRPDLVANPNVSRPTPSMYFNTAAFQTPAAGNFGNSGRNIIIGPGITNLDVALSRYFRVSDLSRMQFRADAYNVLNHPNFVAPPSMQNIKDAPGFGQLFVARSARILQFGLKFLW